MAAFSNVAHHPQKGPAFQLVIIDKQDEQYLCWFHGILLKVRYAAIHPTADLYSNELNGGQDHQQPESTTSYS